MTNHGCGGGGGRIHTVHPERDLEANWEVDLADKLEEYLFKICSGEITGNEEDGLTTVNFAEAALLLQGSVQVYSKKVEYLYNLVLHTLEFLSKQREQSEGTSVQAEESSSLQVSDEDNDLFWNVDDIPVDMKNCLDSSTGRDSCPSHFVKPPSNLVVLEGDCLDASGDGGELESYLLAATHLYQNFILLDPCDAVAVNEFLGGNYASKGKNSANRGSSVRKSFLSPAGRSGGTAHRLSAGLGTVPTIQNCDQGFGNFRDNDPDPSACSNLRDKDHEFGNDDGHGEAMDMSDSDADADDDPWKPLNPHEPGNLKVKPFKKVKTFKKNGGSLTKDHVTSLFPVARPHGTISPELADIWEMRRNASEKERASHIPYYEKLRQLLVNGVNQPSDGYGNHKDEEDNDHDAANDGEFHDFGPHDGDAPEHSFMDEDILNMNDDGPTKFQDNEAFENGDEYCQENLEHLCRSHLDALLASIAEIEKQTDLAARVSSWKLKIEQNLEEQDSHPPFDIHEYGERIITKLSMEDEYRNVKSFADLVKGQEKHDIARSFSALLQLVNNGDVDLEKPGNGEPICYTAVNPFHLRLLRNTNAKDEKRAMHLSHKRAKSPTKYETDESPKKPTSGSVSSRTRKASVKISKMNATRCTPDGKKRRRARPVEPIDLSSTR